MEQKFRPQDNAAYLAEVAAFNKGFHDFIVSPEAAFQIKRTKSGKAKGAFVAYMVDEHLPNNPVKLFFHRDLAPLLAPGMWIDPTEISGTGLLAHRKFGSIPAATFIIEAFSPYQPALCVTGEDDLTKFKPKKLLESHQVGVYSNWQREQGDWHWCPRLFCDATRFKSNKHAMRKFIENRKDRDVTKPAHDNSKGISNIWSATDDTQMFYSEFFKSVVNQTMYARLWQEYTEAVEDAFEAAGEYVPTTKDTAVAKDVISALYAGVAK